MVDRPRAAYGFTITDQSLRFGRPGDVTDSIEVVQSVGVAEPKGEMVAQWRLPNGPAGTMAKLYRNGDEFEYRTPAGVTRVNPAANIVALPAVKDPVLREEHLWGVPSVLCFMHRGEIPIHAAAVEVDGGAVILAAPGKFGKTSLALGFLEAGYRVLTEDVACCRLDGRPALLPGPALLRVRRALVERGIPDSVRVVYDHPSRVYLELDDAARGTSDPVPIRAIVLIGKPFPSIRVESVDPRAALPDLWALNFRLPGAPHRGKAFEALTAIIDAVPVFRLNRPMEWASLAETVEAVVGQAR